MCAYIPYFNLHCLQTGIYETISVSPRNYFVASWQRIALEIWNQMSIGLNPSGRPLECSMFPQAFMHWSFSCVYVRLDGNLLTHLNYGMIISEDCHGKCLMDGYNCKVDESL